MLTTAYLLHRRAADAGLNHEGTHTSTSKRRGTEKSEDSYVVGFDVEPYHKGTRHHWTICRSQRPDELVSWGYEPTRELAEIAANRELEDLYSWKDTGRSGGQQRQSV